MTKEEVEDFMTQSIRSRIATLVWAMTILYPGRDWRGDVLNTLDEKLQDGTVNKNFPTYTDNASKSALTWAKYLDPMDQYGDVWSSGAWSDRIPLCGGSIDVCGGRE
mgnify:CR=1 FL=1